MYFNFEQSDELLTPLVDHVGVNPFLTTNDLSSVDDRDICFSSIPSKKTEYGVTSKDHSNEDNELHQQQQDDLFSSFDFPVLSELSRTELQFDGLPIDQDNIQNSLPSPSMDVQNSSDTNDTSFYPVDDDSTSSTFIWVGGECTVESKLPGDMRVPLSPPISSAASSPSVSQTGSSKKRSYSMMERKSRKKDQNKTAAEKYRLKKRSERNELLTRHTDLKNQNRELKFDMENLTFQLAQFKQLFVDVLQIPIPSTVSK